MSLESHRDPRTILVREKYFSLRPKPLERWLWAQNITPAAERVFWLHWQEGQQRGDWCSEIPIRRVALECRLDPSTVTKAYQVLQRMGCLRRTDPGRDPANPFQQATAVTEVRVPRDLLVELNRHPNRRSESPGKGLKAPVEQSVSDPGETAVSVPEKARDPFAGLRLKDRLKALSLLTQDMSAAEQQGYHESLRTHQPHMTFDADSKLSGEVRGRVLQYLGVAAAEPAVASPNRQPRSPLDSQPRRKVSTFELARLKRDIEATTSCHAAPELLRQVTWSMEEGALRRFAPTHAIHIALKKIRDGAWSRPNRMPPNWMRVLGVPAGAETCRRA